MTLNPKNYMFTIPISSEDVVVVFADELVASQKPDDVLLGNKNFCSF